MFFFSSESAVLFGFPVGIMKNISESKCEHPEATQRKGEVNSISGEEGGGVTLYNTTRPLMARVTVPVNFDNRMVGVYVNIWMHYLSLYMENF